MRAAVSQAHAVVLATPEYHGSISGILKNALDLLSLEHLDGKVVGVISVLGGPANCNALNDLSRVMRSCHAWVMPTYIAVGHTHSVFAGGVIQDLALQSRFEEFATNLVTSATRLSGLDHQPEVTKEYIHENLNTHSRICSSNGKHVSARCADRRDRSGSIERSLIQ
jgi:NAD(P)H-dependent FMN reductase